MQLISIQPNACMHAMEWWFQAQNSNICGFLFIQVQGARQTADHRSCTWLWLFYHLLILIYHHRLKKVHEIEISAKHPNPPLICSHPSPSAASWASPSISVFILVLHLNVAISYYKKNSQTPLSAYRIDKRVGVNRSTLGGCPCRYCLAPEPALTASSVGSTIRIFRLHPHQAEWTNAKKDINQSVERQTPTEPTEQKWRQSTSILWLCKKFLSQKITSDHPGLRAHPFEMRCQGLHHSSWYQNRRTPWSRSQHGFV